MLLQIVAILFGALGGWLGGELVDHLDLGADSGAHLNAPHSVSARPAKAPP
jgi:hypothetical protein